MFNSTTLIASYVSTDKCLILRDSNSNKVGGISVCHFQKATTEGTTVWINCSDIKIILDFISVADAKQALLNIKIAIDSLYANCVLDVSYERLATAPSTPVLAQTYYNTATNQPYVWNGTAWASMAGGAGAADLAHVLTAGRAVDATGTILDFSNNLTIDVNNNTLYSSGFLAMRWDIRVLVNSTGFQTVDWDGAVLQDSLGVPSLAWNGRSLYNATGNTTLNWDRKWLFDAAFNVAMDWQNDTLTDNTGFLSINWLARTLSDQVATNQLLWSTTGIQLPSLAGVGTRFVTTDASGNLTAGAATNGVTSNYSTTVAFVANTPQTITHSLGTTMISLTTWDQGPGLQIFPRYSNRTTTTVDVVSSAAIAAADIVIIAA
jgi:hypothetical protein